MIFGAEVIFGNNVSEPASIATTVDGWLLNWKPTDSTPEGITPTEIVISLAATAAGDIMSNPVVPSLKLERIEQPFPVILKNLEAYPTIIQPLDGETLIFSPIEGNAGAGIGQIVVQGPKTNDGAICWESDEERFVGEFTDSQSQVPRQLTAVLGATSAQQVICPNGQVGIAVSQDSKVEIPIELRATDQANALIAGNFDITLFGPDGEPGFSRPVNFSVQTTVVKSGLAFGIVFAILTLLGFGIPYVALVVFARRQAAFSSQLDGTRWAELPATVGPEGLLTLGEKDPSQYEFIFVDQKRITRAIETSSDTHQVIPPTFWPFKPARTIVKGTDGSSIFTNHDSTFEAGRSIGESSQALGNVFYFVADPKTDSGDATQTSSDDWGNLVRTSNNSVDSQSDRPIRGKVVLLAQGNTNPAEAISKATADVRTWYGWSAVYTAITTGATGSGLEGSSKKSGSSPQEGAPVLNEPASSGSVIEDEWGFGATTQAADDASQNKKSRFGRKNKKSDAGDSKQHPPSDFGFNSSDW